MLFGRIRYIRWLPWPLIDRCILEFFSETVERNSTKLDRKQHLNVIYQVCVFRADRKSKMAALVSDWLTHFRLLLWNRWKEFNETWQEARYQHPLPGLCFSGRSEKQLGWPLIGWDIFDFFSETADWNSTKLDRNQHLKVFYKVCVFRADWINKMAALAYGWPIHFRVLLWNRWMKFNETWQEAKSQRHLPSLCFSGRSEKKMAAWTLIGWDILDFFSETAERNSTKLDRKQDLKVLYQVCVFRVDRKNKMAALASDWLINFQLLLWNRWKEFNDDREQDINVLYQVCVFRTDGKTRWPYWRLICWDILDFFSETAERNSMKLDRKQDLNVVYQVCDLRPISKQKLPPWLICPKVGTLYSGARYVAPWASCCIVLSDFSYLLPFSNNSRNITSTKLRWFQYRINHNILTTNKTAFKMKILHDPMCTFCNSDEETIRHLFWECPIVQNLYIQFHGLLRYPMYNRVFLHSAWIISIVKYSKFYAW